MYIYFIRKALKIKILFLPIFFFPIHIKYMKGIIITISFIFKVFLDKFIFFEYNIVTKDR